jgi:hypothetical protein
MSLDSIHRHNHESLLNLVRKGRIVYACEVGSSNAVAWKSCEWGEYWQGCYVNETITKHLEKFQESYQEFVRPRFGKADPTPYCAAYFRLLAAVLELEKQDSTGSQLLHAVLGFGSIGIRNSEGVTTACAIYTATHPAYLLSRIRNFAQPHDPKFLPLVTEFDPFQQQDMMPRLYYHYRQIPLHSGDQKLFVYPAVDKMVRFESFREIHRLTELLSSKNDTLVRQRAEFIAEKVVGPALQKLAAENKDTPPFKIVDLGGGSGDLCRSMIEYLGQNMPNIVPERSIDWTLVEITGPNHRRLLRMHLRQRQLRHFWYARSGYLEWITNQPESDSQNFHIVLMCRLLNNLSDFSIDIADESVSAKKLLGTKFDKRVWYFRQYLPQTVLDLDYATTNLIVTNTRINHTDGFTFRQPSLTDYFQGLYRLTTGPPPSNTSDRAIFYFVRKFCAESLTLPDGTDALEKLTRRNHCIIIEDVDLDPRMLQRHLKRRGIETLEFETFRDSVALGRSVVLQIQRKVEA